MTSSKIEITNEFIAQWRPMVWKIAKGLRAVAAVYRIDHDDLVQSGMVGLVQAAADFDGRNECSFSSNAWQRIRWSMLDSLREACPQPWNLYQWMLAYNRAADELAGRLGRVPEIEEIAMELGVSVGECRSSLTALATIYADPVHIDNVRGFEDVVPDRKGADALTCAIRAEQDSMINVYLAEQPARVREVILCKYQVGMEEAEIARSLGITRTRVVQILRGMPGRTVGAVQTMRSEINPSKEEIAEKKAREQERLARVATVMERHKLRLRAQKAAAYRRTAGFHRPASGEQIEFLEDSKALMVKAGVKYTIVELSSGKFRIQDERGWHTTEPMARLRTAKFRPVAAVLFLFAFLASAACGLAHAQTCVPFKVVNHHTIVLVKVNGAGPFSFILDTGSQSTLIDPDVFSSVHLVKVGTVDVSGIGGLTHQAGRAMASITRAGQTQADVKAIEYDMSQAQGPGDARFYGILARVYRPRGADAAPSRSGRGFLKI